jgi:hypothetical protein
LAGTIVDGRGFVNSGGWAEGALKALEKPGNIREISVVLAVLPAPTAINQKRHICA